MNIKKLKGLMAENNERLKDISKILNISVVATSKKLKGKSPFKFEEVKILSEHYNVDINIFLN